MSCMCINVELLAGTSIEDAAAEAKAKAIAFDVAYIQFNFNGVSVSVGKRSTTENVVAAFHKALEAKHKFAIVNE